MGADHTDSLIEREQQQLELLPSTELDDELFAGEEDAAAIGPGKEYTAARLFRANPRIYQAIISLRAEGRGILAVAKTLHVSPNTVYAVERREGQRVDKEKEELGHRARAVARMATEAVADDLADPARRKKIPTRDKAWIAGVLTDKSLTLQGAPTSIVEIRQTGEPDQETFNRYIASLPSIEEEPGTGSGGGTPRQKEGGGAIGAERQLAGGADEGAGDQGGAAGAVEDGDQDGLGEGREGVSDDASTD